MKINCVVVTYNRLELLKENIEALKNQTYPLDKIFIIDNHSTDGTCEFLQQFEDDEQMIVITLSKNIGGAGGFSRGMKEAVLNGCDWVWVIDDDTIPTTTALEELVKGTTVTDNVGYVCSKAIWTDGMVHKMNIPVFSNAYRSKTFLPMNYYTNLADVFLVQTASFVSLLVNSEAIRKVGLPISDFFIWGDDTYFTSLVFKKGYTCLYADKSIVIHKTDTNYLSDLTTAPVGSAWKFYYGTRNNAYLRRIKKGNYLSFFFSTLNAYRRSMRRINKRNSEDKAVFKKAVRKGTLDGLTFKPQIEYLPPKEDID